jgi:hypothetical protein
VRRYESVNLASGERKGKFETVLREGGREEERECERASERIY